MMPVGNSIILFGDSWNNQIKESPAASKTKTAEPKTEISVSKTEGKSFGEILAEEISKVNDEQISVTEITEKLITKPEEVNVHDVTIAVSKARSSLNLAQSVIDRITTSWDDILATGNR